jgi:hypothetical protein
VSPAISVEGRYQDLRGLNFHVAYIAFNITTVLAVPGTARAQCSLAINLHAISRTTSSSAAKGIWQRLDARTWPT